MMKLRLSFLSAVLLSGWLAVPDAILKADTPPDPSGYQILFDMREARGPKNPVQTEMDDNTGYDALHYNVEIRFNPDLQFVNGHVDMLFVNTVSSLNEIALNLENNMGVDSVFADGVEATYSHFGEDSLTVNLPQSLSLGDSAQISIFYHGYPLSGSMEALSWDTHQGVPIISSLSEPEGARTWWPCKDIPSDKATARMVWTVPDNLIATSNGLLQSVTAPEPGWKSYEWIENYPITTYLIAVTATNFAHWNDWYVTATNDSLPLDFYVYPEDSLNSTVDFADLPDVIAYFATIYGEYPFIEEKYGHAEFPWGGGMEHQTLTSYGESLINGQNTYHWIMVHELSHQWWGDLVTCGTWADIWLNEGFATYSDALWIEFDQGWTAYQARMDDFRDTYFWYDQYMGRFPIYDPEYMWGGTVYQKGAWILQMLRYVLGDPFWDFFPEWRTRYSFDAATTADMQQTMEDVSGVDLDWFYDEWVYMAGYPEYEWGWTFVPTGDSSRVDLHIAQVQELINQTPIFTMPIEIGVTTTTGYEVHTVQNDQQDQYFSFNVAGVPLDVAFDPNIWILKTDNEVTYVPPPQEITLTPYNPPITIPMNGGSFDFNISITNNEATTVNGDVWTNVTLPGGSVFGPLIGPVNISLPGNSSLNRDRTQNVPANAPSGTYMYNAYIGNYPDEIWDSDQFVFEKLTVSGDQYVGDWFNSGAEFDPAVRLGKFNPPTHFALRGCFPNPFNPTTVIFFDLAETAQVRLDVFDINGRLITSGSGAPNRAQATPTTEYFPSGTNKITFDGSGLPSGIYIYRLTAGKYKAAGKMVLLK